MKYIFYFFLSFLFSFLLLASCIPTEPVDESIPIPKEIDAGSSDNPESGSDSSVLAADSENNLEVGPLVDLDQQYVPITVLNRNLDLDQNEEQIILGKKKDNPEGEIIVFVIDFDTVSNENIISWEGTTQATTIRTFNISFLDVIGDHKLEIICSGINKDGLRTLDIFRQTFSPDGIGLYYNSICSITADGSIDIREHERSQAYKQGQRNGRSFPIITFSQNKNTDNIMDLIREEYYWKYQENRYEKGRTEFIPGKKIEEEQLRDLFTKDTEVFEEFLSGPWLMADPANGETATAIYFNVHERQIIFFSKGIQEIYIWESSHRTRIPNSIYMSVTNEMVPFIKKYVSIFVESLDVIEVEINDRDFTKSNFMWDGRFTRLVESAEKSIITDKIYSNGKLPLEDGDLSGEYTNSFGETITFSYPDVYLSLNNEKLRGKYSVYTFEDKTILDIKMLNDANTLISSKTYIVDHTISTTAQMNIYKLALTEAAIGAFGFTFIADTVESFIRYEDMTEPESVLLEK